MHRVYIYIYIYIRKRLQKLNCLCGCHSNVPRNAYYYGTLKVCVWHKAGHSTKCDTMLLLCLGPYLGHSTKCNTTVRQLTAMCLICLHSTKYSTIAWPWVFRVESCLWLRRILFMVRAESCVSLCRGFSRSNLSNGAKCIFGLFVYQCWSVPTLCFERSTRKEWHNLIGTSSDGGVIRSTKIAWVLATQPLPPPKKQELFANN